MAISMFAGYPAPKVYEQPDPSSKASKQQLLWGDWVEATSEISNGRRRVTKARNASGWMQEEDLGSQRLLEVNFVDVGQGDGCFVVTPDDEWILIDAGEHDNMFWYLRWRFNLKNYPERVIHIDHAIITHPDTDHFVGFERILDSPQITIGTLYHNGIIQRLGKPALGETDSSGKYLTDVIKTKVELTRLLDDTQKDSEYQKILRKALTSGRVSDIQMLSSNDEFLDGFSSGDLTVKVLGPVPEKVEDKLALRRLGSDGVTKNGHSIVLKVQYKGVSLALGGDLNTPAQHYLLEHYAGIDAKAIQRRGVADERALAVGAARKTFQVDVAKACHHGSDDVDDLFIEATDAIATVISSGDAESYAHPRPDALGVTGKYGRGKRPLIFSTELARSPSEQRPEAKRLKVARELDEERERVNVSGTTEAEAPGGVVADYQRAIAVYGLITLRTDGDSVLIAQKLEKASGARQFDYHCLESTNGELAYQPDR